MEGNMRRLFTILGALLLFISIHSLLFSPQIASADSNKHIQVQINGETLVTDVAPVMIEGRVMVPFKAIFAALGVSDIVWEEGTRTVKAVKGETMIELQIDRNTAIVNGQEVTLDVKPQIVNGRTLVPARFVAETLEMDVQWVPKINTVIIKEKEADIAYFENRYMRVPLKYGYPIKQDEHTYVVALAPDVLLSVHTPALPGSDFELDAKYRADIIAEIFDLKSVQEINAKGKKAYRISYTAKGHQLEQVLGMMGSLDQLDDDFSGLFEDMEIQYIMTICQDNIGNIHYYTVFSNTSEKLEEGYRTKTVPFIEAVEYLNTSINYVEDTYEQVVTENFVLTTRSDWNVINGEYLDKDLIVEINTLTTFIAYNAGTLEDLDAENIEELAHSYYYQLEELYQTSDIWYDEYEYLGYYVYEIYLEHEEEVVMYDGTTITYIESVEYLLFENKRGEIISTKFYTPLDDIEATYEYYEELLQGLELRDTLSKTL